VSNQKETEETGEIHRHDQSARMLIVKRKLRDGLQIGG